MSMNRIFLVGYMGSGKSSVGRLLAQKIGWQFIDLDFFIENRYRKSISQIFTESGEAAFREMEHKTLVEVASFEQTVISTGGGVPCFHDNMTLMNQLGTTIYLKVAIPELVKRLDVGRHSRPLIKDKSKEELAAFISDNLQKRERYYNEADIVFESENELTHNSLEHIVTRLADELKAKMITQ